jgi:hypothetical protein
VYRLIYLSTATSRDGVAGQLSDILKVAAKINKGLDITGFLIEVDGTFVQVLEGPRNKLLTLYFKIEQDGRHYNVRLIDYKKVRGRRFAKWGMASTQLSEEAVKLREVHQIIDSKDFDDIENMMVNISRELW